MKSVETALLFAGQPGFDPAQFGQALNARLADTGIQLEEICPHSGADVMFRGPALTLAISDLAMPLAGDSFTGALDSPLSRPMAGVLTETLARHDRHMLVRVTASGPHARALALLQTAHAVTSLLTQGYSPAAVHWRQSNQLLTGAQYRGLADEVSPWALFAQARIDSLPNPGDANGPGADLTLPQASLLIGRPIRISASDQQLDQIHAAALSFLRHAVESGAPIADGHSFGPQNGPRYLVSHIEPSAQFPYGLYELSVVSSDTDKTSDGPARPSEVTHLIRNLVGAVAPPDAPEILPETLPEAPPESPAKPGQPRLRDRTRSMAIGYLMLVLLPPIGALLLLSNALFGSNAWRTGLVATAAVALAMLIGAYTFLNIAGPSSTILSDGGAVSSTNLPE
jgi:hypothetical protein